MLIVQFKRCTDKYLKKTILKDGEIAINTDTNTLHFGNNKTLGGVPVVQLATAQDVKDGTANKVVDAKELINFAQTLPAANGVTDVSSGDNSNQLVVSRIGGSKTLTIDNVEHADNADEATHASQADTATSANSVAWNNVSGKPSSYTPSSHTHDDRYYTESEIDTKLGGKASNSHTHTKSQITDFPSLATVATSGSYSDLSNKPTIPTVNNATLTIQKNGSNVATFTANASSNATANITVPTKTSQLTNDSGFITSSSNITGTSAAATKLATARSISAGDLEFQGSANFDGSGNIKLNITHHRSMVTIGNTNNYPFHRIAYTAQETGNWLDRVITFFIGREYSGGGYGICRIVLRTNDAANGATANCEVQWLVRTSGIPVDAIQVGFNNTAAASYVDVFYKSSGSYSNAICRVISHASSRTNVGQGFAVVSTSSEVNNTTTSNPLTSTESYATIAAAGTKIRGKAYTSTIIASDAGSVNYANSAGSVAWSNVSSRPTKVSQFTNDSKYITGITKAMVTTALGYTPPTSDTNTWIALKGSTTSAAGTAGYAPAPAAGAANRYLRCDGTWQVPPDNNTTYSNMTAATASAAGKAGLVPAPGAGKQTSFLRGDGTWVVPTNTTYSVATTSANGLMSSSDKTKLNKCVTTDSIWIG